MQPVKDDLHFNNEIEFFCPCFYQTMKHSIKKTVSKALSTLIRFQTKTELFWSVFKKICVHTYRFRIVFARPHYNAVSVWKTLLYPQCACSNELDACAFQYIGPRNWHHSWFFVSVFPPHWILTVEWSGARSCLFWWRHRFQTASSSSTLENRVFEKHRFQISPLWRAFSNGTVFGDRFRRCSVDDSRSKTAPFSFENVLVWTGPKRLWKGLACRLVFRQHFSFSQTSTRISIPRQKHSTFYYYYFLHRNQVT